MVDTILNGSQEAVQLQLMPDSEVRRDSRIDQLRTLGKTFVAECCGTIDREGEVHLLGQLAQSGPEPGVIVQTLGF